MDSPLTTSPTYISSTEAAQRYGLTNDHIASLCRRGKVSGNLAGGRLWFVDEPSLKAYLARTREEKAARSKKLSKQIKHEYSTATKSTGTPSWHMAGSAYSLALAVFIVGTFYISAPMAAQTLADVPWSYMPAAVASTGTDAYSATFIPAAEKYLDFVDAVGDVQAQSYRTLGAAVASSITSVPVSLPAPIYDAGVYLPPSTEPVPPQLSFGDTLQVLSLFPDTLADTLVSGWTDMATWYAQGFLRTAYAVSDGQVYAYQSAATAELALSDALVQTWVAAVVPVAEHFVNGVYAAAGAQAYTEEAVLDTMSDSTDTMGASVASALVDVKNSADTVALWYNAGSDRVAARTAPPTNTATVYDAWTDWLAKSFFTPALPQSGISQPATDVATSKKKVPEEVSAPVSVVVSLVKVAQAQNSLSDTAAQAVQRAPVTYLQPIAEPTAGTYVTQSSVTAQLDALANSMRSLIYANSSQGSAVPQYIAAGGNGVNPSAPAVRIDKLSGVTITNAVIDGYLSSQSPVGIGNGGLGTSTAPTYGKVLLGNSNGSYDLVATSSLGITGSGGALNLYASTTIGNGTQNGGLTVSGGATTTGNAYFVGSVGVGTKTPQTALDIVGNAYVRNVAGIVGSNDGVEIATDSSAPRLSLIQGGRSVGLFSADAPGNTYLKNVAGGDLIFNGSTGGNIELARLTNTGSLGLGTSSPFALLSVAGNGFFSGRVTATTLVATSSLTISPLATAAGAFLAISPTGQVIATTTPSGGGSSQWTTSGSNIYFNTGSVGVGTTSPPASLTVSQTSSNTSPFSVYNYKSSSLTTVTLTYTASSTWTKPANLDHVVVELYGAGGGSAGTGGTGGTGGNSTFTYNSGGNTITAGGGTGASSATGGTGGTASGGDTNTSGSSGSAPISGGNGGSAAGPAGGAGGTGVTGSTATNGGAAPGGGGGGLNQNGSGGAGGGGGAYATKTLTASQLGSTEAIQVGGGGGGGLQNPGGNGNTAGAGGGGSGGGAGSGTSAASGSTTGGGGASLYNGSSAVGGSGGTAGNAGGAGQAAGNQPGGGGGGGGGAQGALSADGVNYTYGNGGAGGAGGSCTGSSFCYAASGGGGGGNAAGGNGGAGNTTGVQGMAGGAGGVVVITEYITATTLLSSNPSLTVSNIGNIGIGTTSPFAALSVVGQIVSSYFTATSSIASVFPFASTTALSASTVCISGDCRTAWPSGGSLTGTTGQFAYFSGSNTAVGTSSLFVATSGNVGVGTTSPLAKLTVWGANTTAGILSFLVANSASTTGFSIDNAGNGYLAGNFGLGTTSPYSKLSLWGANTTSGSKVFEVTNSASTTSFSIDNAGFISAGSSNGTNPSNLFTVDTSTGTTTIANLSIGNLVFDVDAGMVNLSDIPIDSNAAAGVIESQTIAIGGTPVITAYGEANGSGVVQNYRAGIATSTPGSFGGSPAMLTIDRSGYSAYGMLVYAGSTASQGMVEFANPNGIVGHIDTSGTATTYNTSSDRRIKQDIATTTMGLADLMRISVADFDFINDPTHATTTGFIAQDLYKVFPYAVWTNGDDGTGTLGTSSPWSVDYGRVTPLIVKAVQDIASLGDTFKNTLIAWFADQANGIHDFFANTTHQKTLCVGDSGNETCITKTQLDALLANANSGSSGGSTVSHTAPPTVTIIGNNPATLRVGDTYSDLGATAKDSDGHDLTVHTFVNGLSLEPVSIDTSNTATDTVDYVATDTWGNTATSSRTVIVGQ